MASSLAAASGEPTTGISLQSLTSIDAQAMEAPAGNAALPPLEESSQSTTIVHHYGPVFNVEKAGNVFSGINYGSVTMVSNDTGFMSNLHERLKISFKADHMYYPDGDERAVRRNPCTSGTRARILEAIFRWILDLSPNSEKIYWLSGQAGAGKTTIAFTIALQLGLITSHKRGRATLGGSFFCSRQFVETRSLSAVIRTIVYQLAIRSKSFQTALQECGRFETVNHGPRDQLMGLLIEPWKRSTPERLANDEPCYVIPIDAVDELEGAGGYELLGALFDVVEREDISGLKFLVTSRSEPALVERVRNFPNKQVCRLEEVPIAESTADIKLYFNKNLSQCATEEQIQRLVFDADGLFIYAATVVEFVKGRNVAEQKGLLKRLLGSSSRRAAATRTLDRLYLQILDTCLVDPRDRDDPDVFQDCLSILHTFLCTIERISTLVVAGILNGTSDNIGSTIDVGLADGVVDRLHVWRIFGGKSPV